MGKKKYKKPPSLNKHSLKQLENVPNINSLLLQNVQPFENFEIDPAEKNSYFGDKVCLSTSYNEEMNKVNASEIKQKSNEINLQENFKTNEPAITKYKKISENSEIEQEEMISEFRRLENVITYETNRLAIGESDEEEYDKNCLEKYLKQVKANLSRLLQIRGGGVCFEDLQHEYEFYFGSSIHFAKYGFQSLLDILNLINDVYDICEIAENMYFLIARSCGGKNAVQSFLADIHEAAMSGEAVSNPFSSKLPVLTKKRICQILTEEFTSGLPIEELYGVYLGFYGADLVDLDISLYNCESLEELLVKECGICVTRCRGHVRLYLNEKACEQAECAKDSDCVGAVKRQDSFKSVDLNKVFPVGELIDVVIGDVYNPTKFWVIRKSQQHSEALEYFMDRLNQFYHSPIGKRYTLTFGEISFGMPVICYHQEDQNFYRGVITAIEDTSTVKVFFVDYGDTVWTSLSQLRFVHHKYSEFPIQAVKASLNGISPINKTKWSKEANLFFCECIKNQSHLAVIHVHDDVNARVGLSLFMLENRHLTNFASILVNKGFGVLVNELFEPTLPKNDASEACLAKHLVNTTKSDVNPPRINTVQDVKDMRSVNVECDRSEQNVYKSHTSITKCLEQQEISISGMSLASFLVEKSQQELLNQEVSSSFSTLNNSAITEFESTMQKKLGVFSNGGCLFSVITDGKSIPRMPNTNVFNLARSTPESSGCPADLSESPVEFCVSSAANLSISSEGYNSILVTSSRMLTSTPINFCDDKASNCPNKSHSLGEIFLSDESFCNCKLLFLKQH